MVQHTLTKGWASSVGGQLSKQVVYSANNELNVDMQVAASSTNLPFAFRFLKAGLQCLYIICDQAVTLHTNSTTTPQDTINLAKGVPYVWDQSSGITNPFAADVTAGYVSNSGSSVANLSVRLLTTG